MNARTRRIYNHVHRGLHNPGHQVIVVDNNSYPIEIRRNSVRFVRVGKLVFSQHDTSQKTKLAVRARTEPITRVIRTGDKWGWISNSEINDPGLN